MSSIVTSVRTHLLLADFSSPTHIRSALPSVFRDRLPNKRLVLESLSQSLLPGELTPRHSSWLGRDNQGSSPSSGQ